MDKVEIVERGELSPEERGERFLWQGNLEGGKGVDREAGVIEIRFAVAISETAVGILLRTQKDLDQSAGIVPEDGARETRHLEHFESQGHLSGLRYFDVVFDVFGGVTRKRFDDDFCHKTLLAV